MPRPEAAVPALDDLDRAILAALAANGRGSWAAIAAAVDSSTSTVQRRYMRLHDAGLVRVIGAVDVLAAGIGVSVMVRVHCGSAAIPRVTAALRERREVRFVSTVTGTADCVAEVVLSRFADLERMLNELFPEPDIRTEALPILRTFTVPFHVFPGALADAGTGSADDRSAGQTSTETASTGQTGTETAGPELEETANAAAPNLDETEGVLPAAAPMSHTERALVAELIADGRKPLVELARVVGKTEAATRRALDELIARGRLRVGPLVAPELLSLETELMVWISVAPELLGPAARQLARHPAVHFAAASAGRFNLIGQAFLTDFSVAYDFTTTVLGALPGVREVDVTVQMTTHKRMWAPMRGGRFEPAATS